MSNQKNVVAQLTDDIKSGKFETLGQLLDAVISLHLKTPITTFERSTVILEGAKYFVTKYYVDAGILAKVDEPTELFYTYGGDIYTFVPTNNNLVEVWGAILAAEPTTHMNDYIRFILEPRHGDAYVNPSYVYEYEYIANTPSLNTAEFVNIFFNRIETSYE